MVQEWIQGLPETEQQKVRAFEQIFGGLRMVDEKEVFERREILNNDKWDNTQGRSFKWVVYTDSKNIYSFFNPSNHRSDTMLKDMEPGDEATFVYTEREYKERIYYTLKSIKDIVNKVKPIQKDEEQETDKPVTKKAKAQVIFDPSARKAAAERADSLVRNDAIDITSEDLDTRIAYIHALTIALEQYFTGQDLAIPIPEDVREELEQERGSTPVAGDPAKDDLPPEEE